ncbi:hypothetical protein [Dysgonomonas sp.]
MKKTIATFICFFTTFSFFIRAQVPTTNDLMEDGKYQRRDLSITGSRIIVNPFNFHTDPQKVTASVYSNSNTLPLNIGYLTIGNDEQKTEGRFGREFRNVLEIRKRLPDGTIVEAKDHFTEWYPHALPFQSTYQDNTKISGYDFFYDENTITRVLNLDKKGKYILSGAVKGIAVTDEKNQVIIIEGANCKYTFLFKGLDTKKISYYAAIEDLKAQSNKLNNPKNAKWWAYDISNTQRLDVCVSYALTTMDNTTFAANIKKAADRNNIDRAYSARISYWNDFLQNKIPHPLNFELENIDKKGVVAQQLRLAYYKAWVLLAQNIVPPEESEYPYYQVATGKSSLWDEGHEIAPFSAAWESFIGLQLFAYIDTNISWSCLKGLLSLVDQTGMLGGESLPSRKAQSAWILYQLSKDKTSLREVYPALERYLNWRMKEPRWIYKDATKEGEKDAEFVVSAIIDMDYMISIAKELDIAGASDAWKEKRNRFIDQYKHWFWKTPQDMPTQHLNNKPERMNVPIMITTGLYIKEIQGDYYDGIMGWFYQNYDINKTFGGFQSPKYPDMDFTIYGLIQHNKDLLAKGLLESNLRDIIRANCVFAESYSTIDDIPYPDGVRPSIFGMATIIDFTLLKNGFMYSKGSPCITNLYPDSNVGVDNIPYSGKYINIRNNRSNEMKVFGTAMGNTQKIVLKPGQSKFLF